MWKRMTNSIITNKITTICTKRILKTTKNTNTPDRRDRQTVQNWQPEEFNTAPPTLLIAATYTEMLAMVKWTVGVKRVCVCVCIYIYIHMYIYIYIWHMFKMWLYQLKILSLMTPTGFYSYSENPPLEPTWSKLIKSSTYSFINLALHASPKCSLPFILNDWNFELPLEACYMMRHSICIDIITHKKAARCKNYETLLRYIFFPTACDFHFLGANIFRDSVKQQPTIITSGRIKTRHHAHSA